MNLTSSKLSGSKLTAAKFKVQKSMFEPTVIVMSALFLILSL